MAEVVEAVVGAVPTEVEVLHIVVVGAMAHHPMPLEAGIVVVIVRGEGLQVDLDIPLTRFLYPEVELEGA